MDGYPQQDTIFEFDYFISLVRSVGCFLFSLLAILGNILFLFSENNVASKGPMQLFHVQFLVIEIFDQKIPILTSLPIFDDIGCIG